MQASDACKNIRCTMIVPYVVLTGTPNYVGGVTNVNHVIASMSRGHYTTSILDYITLHTHISTREVSLTMKTSLGRYVTSSSKILVDNNLISPRVMR